MRKRSWRGKQVLVTGAGGFIGSHLTQRLLREGARVRALVHYNALGSWGWLEALSPAEKRRTEVRAGDIRDPGLCRALVSGCDTVFHLAALIAIPYSYAAPHSYAETNILGTLHLLEAARASRVRCFVQTSTSETYGTARYVPIDEAHPLQGQSPYAATKIGADKLAESFWRSFGLPVVTVRPFNTYGPRQSARAVIPTILTQALTGAKRIRLGNLEATRDFNFVDDTAVGFLALAAAPEAVGETVNLGTGREVSIGELAQAALRVCNSKARIAVDTKRLRPAASEVDRLCADASKAKRLSGWQPRVPLETGLARTAAWIRKNLDRYKADLYTL